MKQLSLLFYHIYTRTISNIGTYQIIYDQSVRMYTVNMRMRRNENCQLKWMMSDKKENLYCLVLRSIEYVECLNVHTYLHFIQIEILSELKYFSIFALEVLNTVLCWLRWKWMCLMTLISSIQCLPLDSRLLLKAYTFIHIAHMPVNHKWTFILCFRQELFEIRCQKYWLFSFHLNIVHFYHGHLASIQRTDPKKENKQTK